MLPTKSLFAFFLLHGGGILDLRSGLPLSSCPLGCSARGQKRYGAALQRVVPVLFFMDYSPRRDTRGVLPHSTSHRMAPRPSIPPSRDCVPAAWQGCSHASPAARLQRQWPDTHSKGASMKYVICNVTCTQM